MLQLLKKTTIGFLLLLVFLISTSSPVLAQTSFIEALQAPEYNLESLVAGKSLVNPDAPSGMLPILGRGFTIMALGSYDDQGNRIASGGVNILADLTNNLYNHQPTSGVKYLA